MLSWLILLGTGESALECWDQAVLSRDTNWLAMQQGRAGDSNRMRWSNKQRP
jgi:hypothetical protein